MSTSLSERPNLLLADDDRVLCQVLSKALESRGYMVDIAHDGASALKMIEKSPPEFAVVDLRLPDMSGLKVVQRLKAADEHTTIVVLTGYGSIATAVEAIKLGAIQYLTKPTNANEIERAFKGTTPDADAALSEQPLSVDRLEWEHIQRVMASFDDNVSASARALNMHRRTLQRKLNKRPPRPA